MWKHDSFEPCVVMLTFTLTLWSWVFVKNYMPSMNKYKIRPHKFLLWEMEDYKWEFFGYIVPLLVFDFFFPRRRLVAYAPSFLRLCLEVIGCLIVYDALFFFAHLTMHKVPWLYRYSHARHHDQSPVTAIDTIKLSASEQAVDVACSIAAVNAFGAHPLSRVVYNVIIIMLLCDLHCGYDFPWMLQNVVPFGLWGGSLRHDKHHEIGNVYFQKFFTYLDDGFGFVERRMKAKLAPKEF